MLIKNKNQIKKMNKTEIKTNELVVKYLKLQEKYQSIMNVLRSQSDLVIRYDLNHHGFTSQIYIGLQDNKLYVNTIATDCIDNNTIITDDTVFEGLKRHMNMNLKNSRYAKNTTYKV
jgi:hypothetical protein